MPAKHRHLLDRDGRFFARIVIPKDLRPFLDNKHELRESLGPDRRTAIARLATAVAGLQAQIAIAERKAQLAKGEAVRPGRYPLPVNEIVLRRYNDQLAFDSEIRNSDDRYANMEPDDSLIPVYRDGIAGKLSDASLRMLVGNVIERYRGLGNTTAEFGTTEWRTLAQALCVAELEILGRVMERHEGDFTGKPEHPVLVKAIEGDPVADDVSESEYNRLTFSEIIEEQERLTKMGLGGFEKSEATLKKYRQTVYAFEHFRRSKYAATVTLEEGEAWRNAMLAEGKLSRKTIRDKLASIRAILTWGQKQCRGKLFPNTPNKTPFEFLEMPNAEVRDSAARTYTLEQARKVLQAARTEKTKPNFRWLPWLLAYTGMRIGEALQLEKGDIFELEGHWFAHIRVGEGRTTKTRKSRKVPLHTALVAEGFLEFVETAPAGKLFPGTFQDQRLREWILEGPLNAYKDTPAPNHGFRHLFEDALHGDVSHKAALYITGRSSGSSADDYGGSDLKLLELAKQMEKVRNVFDL
ncbi:MAG TPA: DUF6538 domain-containing protein [Pseudorhizobium sp.]|jgi:integrase|nr:DUF6538 domain-containing protein [Pseudorhizobium sp.]